VGVPRREVRRWRRARSPSPTPRPNPGRECTPAQHRSSTVPSTRDSRVARTQPALRRSRGARAERDDGPRLRHVRRDEFSERRRHGPRWLHQRARWRAGRRSPSWRCPAGARCSGNAHCLSGHLTRPALAAHAHATRGCGDSRLSRVACEQWPRVATATRRVDCIENRDFSSRPHGAPGPPRTLPAGTRTRGARSRQARPDHPRT
jgi:hypothetical protein